MSNRALVTDLAEGSAARKYRDMFVGRPSALAFLRYELIIGLAASMPGAAGYYLRKKLFPLLFGASGAGCLFGRSVTLRCPGSIELGSAVVVDDLAVLDAKGPGARLAIGDRVLIGRGAILSCNAATIRIGTGVSMGPYCVFSCKGAVEVGNDVSIGSGSRIMAGTHAMDDPDIPPIQQARSAAGVTIGDGVWIGAGVTVLDGASIGRNSVIGANAVVKGEIPPGVVAAGVPARILYSRSDRVACRTSDQRGEIGAHVT